MVRLTATGVSAVGVEPIAGWVSVRTVTLTPIAPVATALMKMATLSVNGVTELAPMMQMSPAPLLGTMNALERMTVAVVLRVSRVKTLQFFKAVQQPNVHPRHHGMRM